MYPSPPPRPAHSCPLPSLLLFGTNNLPKPRSPHMILEEKKRIFREMSSGRWLFRFLVMSPRRIAAAVRFYRNARENAKYTKPTPPYVHHRLHLSASRTLKPRPASVEATSKQSVLNNERGLGLFNVLREWQARRSRSLRKKIIPFFFSSGFE